MKRVLLAATMAALIMVNGVSTANAQENRPGFFPIEAHRASRIFSIPNSRDELRIKLDDRSILQRLAPEPLRPVMNSFSQFHFRITRKMPRPIWSGAFF